MSSHWQTHNLIAIPVCRVASGWKPAMYNQRKRPVRTRDGVPLITFTQPRTCDPVPSPQSQEPLPLQGQNGHCGGKQATPVNFPFVSHIGSVNREGVASTRKATTKKKRYTVEKFRACAASVSLQSLTVASDLSMASAEATDESCEKLLTVAVALSAASTAATDKSCEMGVECQRSTRASRATVEGTCLLLVVILVSLF